MAVIAALVPRPDRDTQLRLSQRLTCRARALVAELETLGVQPPQTRHLGSRERIGPGGQ